MAARLPLVALLVPALALAARAGDGAGTLFEQAKARARRMPSASGKTGSAGNELVWASFAQADLPALRKAGVPLGEPAASGSGAAVFRVAKEDLPAVSEVMHEAFNRCGGFFAHENKDQAEADLAPRASVQAVTYTVDQQAWVRPLLSRVQEGQLRATIETLAAYHNRYYEADTGAEAARWILGRWLGLAKGVPGASGELVTHSEWKQPSVVLTIPGTDLKDEIVVLGGHLDSINGWGGATRRAPGADDNASGIAVVTEALRIIATSGVRPRRTLQFMGYAAEEVGLRGSQDIAERYQAAGKKVVAVIQFDMTNFKGADNDVYLLTDNVDSGLTGFLGKLVDAYLGIKWGTIECGYACSDHASWTRSGYAASAAFESTMEGMNHALHTEQDTLATSGGNAEHSVNFAKLAVAFAGEAAKASASPSSAAR